MNKILKIIFTLSVFVVNISIPLIFFANFKPFYAVQFEKRGVYDFFELYGISKEEAGSNFDDLLKYIQFRQNSLSEDFYSVEDITHMKDVKNLFFLLYIAAVSSIADIVLLAAMYRKKVIESLKLPALGTLATLVFIAFLNFTVSFDKLFTLFHKVFFRNDYWMLSPETSNLIKFFPQRIFEMQMLYILAGIFVLSLLELGAYFVHQKWKEGRIKKY